MNKIDSKYISVPPSVDRPREVTLTEIILDKDLRITCPATGIPPPKITWFINNQPIKNDTSRVSLLDDGWTLEIRNVQGTDATRYRCKAENEAGQSEKMFDVNILCKFISVYMPPIQARNQDNVCEWGDIIITVYPQTVVSVS